MWTSNCCQDVYAPEPEAVSEQLDWEAGVRASEVGPGVQGLPHRRRWLHEHPAGPDRRVDRRELCRSPRRGSHQVIHFECFGVDFTSFADINKQFGSFGALLRPK